MVVSFGSATLVLTDLADRLLGHWALAGVAVVAHGPGGTVYGMAEGETLTIRDREMVAAIAAVTRDLVARLAPPQPRRRLPIALFAGAVLVGALAASMPALVVAQATRMVPPERAEELGEEMLLLLVESYGAPCGARATRPALDRLAALVAPASPPVLRVLPLDLPVAIALPGEAVVIDGALVAADPVTAVGAAREALGTDPVEDMMRATGFAGSLRYLFTGRISERGLRRAVDAALAAAPEAVPPEYPVEISDADKAMLRNACS